MANNEWDIPGLKRNEKTGEFGYWTGQDMIILPKSMSGDNQGVQSLIDNLKATPAKPNFSNFEPEQQQAIEKLYNSLHPASETQPPANKEPGLMDRIVSAGKQVIGDVKTGPVGQLLAPPTMGQAKATIEAEKERQQGMTGKQIAGETAMTVASAIPALVGGAGVGMMLPKAVSKTGSAMNRLATAAGAAAGEYLGQKAGISPDSLQNLALAAAAGGMGGRIERGAVTAAEKKAQAIATAAPIREAEVANKEMFKTKLAESLSKPDVQSQKIIQPIEDIIIKERGRRPMPKTPGPATPETNQRIGIVNELADISDNLGNLLKVFVKPVAGVPLPKTPVPNVNPNAVKVGSPVRTAIPSPGNLPSEAAAPSMPKKQPQQASAFGTPATQTNTPQSPAPGGIQITGLQQTDSAQTVVQEVQRLAKLRERARAIGANDLAHDIDKGLNQVRKTIGYEEAAPFWAKGKGLEESKINVRGASKTAREMNRLEGRRSTTFSEVEKQELINQAAKSEQIDRVLAFMMQNPTGQKLLRAGFTPRGALKPGIIHAGGQLLAHQLGREE